MENLFINNRTDKELLKAAEMMAVGYYLRGWRLCQVQFADLEKIEYQNVFAIPSPTGDKEWDPVLDDYDVYLDIVAIYRADGTEKCYHYYNGVWEIWEDKDLPYAPEAEEE